MKEIIKKQISEGTWKKINELEDLSQENQKLLGLEIIDEISIIDFEPYIAYDPDGNVLIALHSIYSGNSLSDCIYSGKHDVMLSNNEVYIEDESFLEEREKYAIDRIQKDKKIQEINERLEIYSDELSNKFNFQRPLCVGNYEKITKIDEEIEELEILISNLEDEIKVLEDEK